MAIAFISYGALPPYLSPRGVSADRPLSISRSMDLAWLCCGRTRGALLAKPPAGARLHQHRGGLAARTFNLVATAYGSHDARPVRSPPRGVSVGRQRSTCRAVRPWRACVVAQREARSSPNRRLGLDCIITETGRQCGVVSVMATAFISYGTLLPCLSPLEYRPTALGAHRAVLTWRGCVVAERGARSLPCRWLKLDCTNTAAGWRHRPSNLVATAFDSHGARPACSSPRGVSVDRQRSTRRAVHTWRGCVVAQLQARSSPSRRLGLDCIITATGRQHGLV